MVILPKHLSKQTFMKTNFIAALFVSISMITFGQKKVKSQPLSSPPQPKLVVGIIVDQMREDYLYRFYHRYSEGGLKRLMNEGFNCRNNQYHYATTVTGPGHAHVYTGSTPAISGIVGNEWYDKYTGKDVYVAGDSTVSTIGEGSATAGKMSPKNLLVTTITDQLRLSNEFQSKVIGIAFKDRGAIMPAGHTGKAFWYDASSTNWITSSYYMDKLPEWVSSFNQRKLPAQYMTNEWKPLYDLATYTETEADEQPYETTYSMTKPVFPYKITTGNLAMTPYGNTLTKEFAISAIEGEQLGADAVTDFLAVSFSTPDYTGHAFGPHSKEIEDVYLRFDLEIEQLLTYLDTKIGKNQYVVFLTADHGVADIPAYLKKHNIPAGLLTTTQYKTDLNKMLNTKFSDGVWLNEINNNQLFFNHTLMEQKNVSLDALYQVAKNYLLSQEGIYHVVKLEEVSSATLPTQLKEKVINMYNPRISGDVMMIAEPAWFSGGTKGTTHGSPWRYDTHVPLLWYGWKIPKGETVKPTYIADIAPTLAILLRVLEPNGCIGQPIEDLFD